jgi:hypothetical protein
VQSSPVEGEKGGQGGRQAEKKQLPKPSGINNFYRIKPKTLAFGALINIFVFSEKR